MAKLYGMIFTGDGQAVVAKIAEEEGQWKLFEVSYGAGHRVPRIAAVLSQDMYLRVPSHWQRVPLAEQESRPQVTQSGRFFPCKQNSCVRTGISKHPIRK